MTRPHETAYTTPCRPAVSRAKRRATDAAGALCEACDDDDERGYAFAQAGGVSPLLFEADMGEEEEGGEAAAPAHTSPSIAFQQMCLTNTRASPLFPALQKYRLKSGSVVHPGSPCLSATSPLQALVRARAGCGASPAAAAGRADAPPPLSAALQWMRTGGSPRPGAGASPLAYVCGDVGGAQEQDWSWEPEFSLVVRTIAQFLTPQDHARLACVSRDWTQHKTTLSMSLHRLDARALAGLAQAAALPDPSLMP
ncbi:hypothetical protein EON68_04235, partial [archaeon]